jgi:hypothetical protein
MHNSAGNRFPPATEGMAMHAFVSRNRPLLFCCVTASPGQRAALPGFGKTLLLADWVKAVAGRPTAWVSVRAARVDGANSGVTPIKPDVDLAVPLARITAVAALTENTVSSSSLLP